MNKSLENSVTASLNFDFRGQNFNPTILVNLNEMVVKKQQLSHLYTHLGASIGFDSYRHEYDVMAMQDILFSEPVGLACDFVTDGNLDYDGFMNAWHQQRIQTTIQSIAKRHLNISDLMQHNELRKALMDSYKAGQKDPN